MNPDYPFVVGFCGRAGVGKTSVANSIVPQARVSEVVGEHDDPNRYEKVWDHLYLAMPLYELLNVKQTIEGEARSQRTLYQIHDILLDIFGRSPLYGAPDYDYLVGLVDKIAQMPTVKEGKDRSFLQDVGTMCRDVNTECFVQWVQRKINDTFRTVRSENEDNEYICIVSDVRMPNEAKFIHEHPNGLLLEFTASDHVRNERLMDRDGYLMTEAQANHESERVDDIPSEYVDVSVNTDGMSLREHAESVYKTINERFF